MIYGRPPYDKYRNNARIQAIIDPSVRIEFPPLGLGDVQVPTSAIELLKKCFLRNPSHRATIEECLNSDFLLPKVVSVDFVRDLVILAVTFGKQLEGPPISNSVCDSLVDRVMAQIRNLNYG